MSRLLLATLFYFFTVFMIAYTHLAEAREASPEQPMLLVCRDTSNDLYFVRLPSGLRIFGIGLNGTASCIVVMDTQSNTRTLCATPDADKCLLVPATELVL